MIGLDGNVLLRHLIQDDPVQSPRATSFLTTRLTEDEPGFVSVVALAEIVWVLERTYRFSVGEIAGAIERMLAIDTLMIENEQEVFFALTVLKSGLGSFADALIAALGAKAGCAYTVTFDRRALQIPGFAAP
ncbi:MAG TPA: type II toxin-antitoxin system VapC family toxin [Stellaceae bacterium]|nr:type II toxin-antitoxin system VapC family toxin [Stellaceae bacterium]